MAIFTRRLGTFALALLASAASAMAASPVAVPAAMSEAVTLRGKIGDQLSGGAWHLQVLSVERSAAYESQFLDERTTTKPDADADELVVVKCRITNGEREPRTPMLSAVHPHHTALTGAPGTSYAPFAFDKAGGHSDEGVTLAPGAATTFAALFSVPKGTMVGEMTFSLQTAYDDFPDGGVDVHVTLAQ